MRRGGHGGGDPGAAVGGGGGLARRDWSPAPPGEGLSIKFGGSERGGEQKRKRKKSFSPLFIGRDERRGEVGRGKKEKKPRAPLPTSDFIQQQRQAAGDVPPRAS